MDEAVSNAQEILDKAAEHDRNGSLHKLFTRAKAVALINESNSEITVSSSIGKGIVLFKNDKNKWSLPWACTFGGTGWGLGGADKQVIVFMMDEATVDSLSDPVGLDLSDGVSLAMGSFGKDTPAGSHFVSESGTGAASDFMIGNGAGGIVSIAFAKGTYVPASANGAEIFPDKSINGEFYGENASAEDTWKTNFPKEEKLTQEIRELHKKLELLSEGKNEDVNPDAYKNDGGKNVATEAPSAIDNVVKDVISKQEQKSKQQNE